MILDPYIPCDVPRQSGGATQVPSLTRRLELGRNLGTGPYLIQERFMRNNYQNPISEDVDEFGKVGAETSYLQSQMHSDYDSAEKQCRL